MEIPHAPLLSVLSGLHHVPCDKLQPPFKKLNIPYLLSLMHRDDNV